MSGARAACGSRRRWSLVAILAVAGLLGARPGAADEPPKEPPKEPAKEDPAKETPPKEAPEKAPPTFADLVAEHKAAVAEGNRKDQMRLLGALSETAAKAEANPKDEAAKKAVEENKKTARGICRKALASRDFEVVVAALGGYATLRIPGSSADLKPFADVKLSEKRPPPVRMAALTAWATIHDQGSHGTLLDHIRLPFKEQEKKDLALVAARGVALYRTLPKGVLRYEVLRDFMQMFDAIYNSTNYMATAEGSQWFALLHPVMVETFNAFTQATVRDYTACVEWWRDNRRKIQAGTD